MYLCVEWSSGEPFVFDVVTAESDVVAGEMTTRAKSRENLMRYILMDVVNGYHLDG